jgi:hypothetical protein
MDFSPLRNIERGGKIIKKEDCDFIISDTKSLMGDKEKGTKIELKDKEEFAGEVTIDHLGENEIGDKYVQLRSISVKSPYLGGNASQLLYEKSIEFAESLNKKLLFDSSLTVGAYKSFKKLENLGYEIIENPIAKFDGAKYTAPGSWVLRVERKQKDEK